MKVYTPWSAGVHFKSPKTSGAEVSHLRFTDAKIEEKQWQMFAEKKKINMAIYATVLTLWHQAEFEWSQLIDEVSDTTYLSAKLSQALSRVTALVAWSSLARVKGAGKRPRVDLAGGQCWLGFFRVKSLVLYWPCKRCDSGKTSRELAAGEVYEF